ncbi:two-component system response regulator [Roseateles terrae]|uniref:PAS domain S-box-containing protein n=1 Tax=Roseateles terrae TaxID=431060 RepID=A0ABR6GRB8_9BURK|nr:GGDEF domain-containing response regulator [Roseateles terrae]MBB3194657.1 PAS domain S-box-containing protein [Roseateles terrae]
MPELAEASRRTVRIQIVEDERIVALDLRAGLEQLGYEVVGIAANEPDALKLARHAEPDLVLMDIHLDRGSDGISAARQLRELLQVPVIFLSAYGEPETLQRAAEAAPYGYLLKPFELRELNATVRMAMVRRAAERQTEDAERRLRLALESARLAVLELHAGPTGHQLRWVGQDSVPELRGLTQAETLGQLTRGLEPRGQTALQTLLQLGTPVDLTCAWQPEDEPGRWLEIHARHFEPEGLVIGMVRDVSERVERENRLRQASVAFDATDEAILFLDGDQRVLSCNSAFAQLTGWAMQDVIGHQPDEFLFARRQGDAVREPGARQWHGEVTCRRRDGSCFPALQHFAAVVDDEGVASHHVLSFADISEIRQAQHALHHQALHDALTGLGNRVLLQQALQAADGPLALFFMDLDGFKTINDTLGHDAGDDLLRQVATRIRGLLRKDDVAVRLGGDEFVVLLRQMEQEDAALQVAQKLLAAVARPVLLDIGGGSGPGPVSSGSGGPEHPSSDALAQQTAHQTVLITASIGVALYPGQVDSPHTLLRAADAAMYQAKARGRCRAVLFKSAMADVASHRLKLEQGLRLALDQREFRLAWQPVVDLRSGRIVGAEVLLRWAHPQMGEVPPARFIPVAEDTGLIIAIGAWVLDQAVAQAAAWRAQGLPELRVAVNVSVRQFDQDDMPTRVAQTLARHGFPAHLLELELTESLIAQEVSTELALRRLRDLGVRLALDDFGTGFSSLAQLTALPMDRLKIDRSFIQSQAQLGSSQAVVRSIVALASGLNLDITAEGVETLDQQQWLLSLADMQAQGYLFHKPMPPEALARLLMS